LLIFERPGWWRAIAHFHTAFVSRLERGPNKTNDVKAECDFDVIADHFTSFAAKLGC
jgi:hypothetical protein